MKVKEIKKTVLEQIKPYINDEQKIKQWEEFLPMLALVKYDSSFQEYGWIKNESPDWINMNLARGLEITQGDGEMYNHIVKHGDGTPFCVESNYFCLSQIINKKIAKLNKYYLNEEIEECDLYISCETRILSDTDTKSFDEKLEFFNEFIQTIYSEHSCDKVFKNIFIEIRKLEIINSKKASPSISLVKFTQGESPMIIACPYDKYEIYENANKYIKENCYVE